MSDTNVTPENTPEPTPPATSQGNSEGGNTTPATPLFTQADVDRIVGERAKRAEKSAISGLLETVGLEDVDSLKTVISEANQRKEAEMSATEKLQAQIDAMQKSIEEKDNALAQVTQARLNEKRDNGLLQLLGKAHNANDALLLIKAKHADTIADLLSDDGTFDSKKAQSLVDNFASDNAHLFASTAPGSPSNFGGNVPEPTNKQALKEAKRMNSRIIQG